MPIHPRNLQAMPGLMTISEGPLGDFSSFRSRLRNSWGRFDSSWEHDSHTDGLGLL